MTPVEFRGDLWHQKTRLHELSCGFICVILCLAILVEHRLVTDRHYCEILRRAPRNREKYSRCPLIKLTERRVLKLIPVICSQPAGDVSYKRGARPAVTLATLKRAATNFAAW